MIDTDSTVYVYQTSTNTLLGSWTPKTDSGASLTSPTDIGTDGSLIWVVDNNSGGRKVYLYDNTGSNTGADRLSGTQNALSVGTNGSLNLDSANSTPTGLAVDASRVFVTNSGTREVFVYNRSTGAYVGKWKLDPANTNPTDITTEPTGSNTFGTGLWVVDKNSKEIFYYESSVGWTSNGSGSFRTAKASHALTVTRQSNGDNITVNTVPEGIADPPVLTIAQPTNNIRLPEGETVLVSGQVDLSQTPGATVYINGTVASALDVNGNYFGRYVLSAGVNQYSVTVRDSAGSVVTQETRTVTGNQTSGLDLDSLVDVTPSFRANYGRTSFDSSASGKLLYSDVAIENIGNYPVGAQVLVGIRNISNPLVRVKNPSGVLDDGTFYLNYGSSFLANPVLPLTASSDLSVAFYNPEGLPFTYDLVFLAPVNTAPRITSIPPVEVLPSNDLAYQVVADDLEGDDLTYTLVAAPVDMTISSTGAIEWEVPSNATGNYDVVVRVEDGFGGVTLQQFTLQTVSGISNRAPVFDSTPITQGNVGSLYEYGSHANDADNDTLTYRLVPNYLTNIAINNPGFESPALNPGGYTLTAPTGWTFSVSNPDAGTFYPTTSHYPGGINEGNNVFYGNSVTQTNSNNDCHSQYRL